MAPLKAIKEKDSLYQRFIATRNVEHLAIFKKSRNKANKLIQRSKRYYFDNLFNNEATHSSEAIWKHLNILLNRCSNKKTTISEITLNGERITGKEFANEFNDYFISVAKSTHSPDCTHFLSPKLRETAFLYRTDEGEIRGIFSTLKNSNCCDIEDLQMKPVKNTVEIIASILVHIAHLPFSE